MEAVSHRSLRLSIDMHRQANGKYAKMKDILSDTHELCLDRTSLPLTPQATSDLILLTHKK